MLDNNKPDAEDAEKGRSIAKAVSKAFTMKVIKDWTKVNTNAITTELTMNTEKSKREKTAKVNKAKTGLSPSTPRPQRRA